MIVILHNIRSSHNAGSIFRTADAAGVEKIYCCGITPGPRDRYGRPNEKFLKVSLSAEKTVSWEHVSSVARAIERAKKDGYEIWALEQSRRAISLFAVRRAPKKLALIVGNEVRGLPSPVLKRADRIVEIPMFGAKESLNVAVAFGIAAYAIRYI